MITSSVTIVDYGMGNIKSLFNAFNYLGASVNVSSDPYHISNSDALVLPGVGSFRVAMNSLTSFGLDDVIKNAVLNQHKKILGICLGFQLLSLSSTEDGFTNGLGIIDASVDKFVFDSSTILKTPHIGFNTVNFSDPHPLFFNIANDSNFYFVHSFRLPSFSDKQADLSICNYGQSFISSYQTGNVMGTQFHPEKSQSNGLKLLYNFLAF